MQNEEQIFELLYGIAPQLRTLLEMDDATPQLTASTTISFDSTGTSFAITKSTAQGYSETLQRRIPLTPTSPTTKLVR